jgi:hypothetical protein
MTPLSPILVTLSIDFIYFFAAKFKMKLGIDMKRVFLEKKWKKIFFEIYITK